ncbi:hypothetical protein JHK87_034634 [Glycine soja]|nr:hypothetical protein JHK87_034634 [Glycine soja]
MLVEEYFALYLRASDVIARTAFGSSYEEGRRIFQLQKELAELTMKVIMNVYIPGWRFVRTATNRRMKEIDRDIKASLTDMIKKRERALKTGEATKEDLLGILLESNHKEIQEHGNNKNVGINLNDVMEECKLFYFAGQETTSVLLVWTMVLLSRYPDWQARAREKVLQVFGKQAPNFDGLSHLKIVSVVLWSTLDKLFYKSLMESKLKTGTILIVDRYSYSGVASRQLRDLILNGVRKLQGNQDTMVYSITPDHNIQSTAQDMTQALSVGKHLRREMDSDGCSTDSQVEEKMKVIKKICEEIGLPAPDVVVFLDISPEVCNIYNCVASKYCFVVSFKTI